MDKTIEYFKKISSIPRESKNESAVADFLVNFAKEHNLYFVRDKFNNVLIKKVNKKRKPTILQSHTDMVCVKEPNYDFNFSTMTLKLVEENGYLMANKTSLGADNGIGVAMILSLLEEENNFNIEALFTTDEEVTMTGATNFDYSLLTSNKLISLDGFSSHQLINGCASICDSMINFKPEFIAENKQGYTITISGLKGGHSGEDINNNVGNAINILTEVLCELKNIELTYMKGGNQFNFIPNFATATFCFYGLEFNNLEDNYLKSIIDESLTKYKKQYNNIEINISKSQLTKHMSCEETKKLLNVLNQIKTGVIVGTNNKIELSQNLASISLEDGIIKISNRANTESYEEKQILFLRTLAEKNNYNYKIFDRQCGLVPNENSILTTELSRINREVNKQDFQVITKHISLEGAIFKQKKPDLDIAIVSPDIYDVHSTKERVFIPSISKTYNLLINYLKLQ